MATPILISTLHRPQVAGFLTDLSIQEIVKTMWNPTLRKVAPVRKAKPPVEFYRKVAPDIVLLPYHYARSHRLGPWSEDPVVRDKHTAFLKTLPMARPLSPSAQFTGTLRPYQEPVMDQCLMELAEQGTTTLGVYPGFGKTTCSAYLMLAKRKRAVIVVHRIPLLAQWMTTFEKWTTGVNVLVWDAARKNRKVPFPSDVDVVIAMNTCVSALPDRDQFGMLVLDEAHLLCTESNVDLFFLFSSVEYVILCSATPERKDGMHRLTEAVAGTHGTFLGNPVAFELYRVETHREPGAGNEEAALDAPNDEGEGESRLFSSEWGRVLYTLARDAERNRFLADLIHRHLAGKKVVVVTFTTTHVRYLYRHLIDLGESVATLFQSQTHYDDARVLIGTSSKISVGFDPSGVCRGWDGRPFDALVLCTSIASFAPLVQTLGRAFRSKDPAVYYIVDDHPTIEKHWRFAVSYAKEAKGTVKTWKASC